MFSGAVSAATKCQAPTAMGCFVDPYHTPAGSTLRVLNHSAVQGDGKLTREKCLMACCRAGYGVGSLAGLENGHDCYCDSSFGPYTIPQAIKIPHDSKQ